MRIRMKMLLVFVMVVLMGSKTYATCQDPEILYYDGKSYALLDCPLVQYYNEWQNRPQFEITCTSNWKGYIGTWEIEKDRLYLVGIDAKIVQPGGDSVAADLKTLFGEKCVGGKVAATWFTGELHFQDGELIESGFCEGLYEWDIVLQIESGKVTGKEVFDNRKSAGQRAMNAALVRAVADESFREAKALLEKGADPDARDIDLRRTVLMTAVEKGNRKIVKLLLKKGADVNLKDNNSDNALMMLGRMEKATYAGAIAKMLLKKGADVNQRSWDGSTALLLESLYGHTEVVKLLIDRGADVNAPDMNGVTPLMCASENGFVEISGFLLENGADVSAADKDGNTALKLAKEKNYPEIVQMMEKKDEPYMQPH